LKPAPVVTGTIANINELLIDFVESMYVGRAQLYLVVHAILAFEKNFLDYKGHLGPTWDTIFSWKMRVKFSTRVPIPPQILLTLVLYCLMKGFRSPQEAKIWIPFGLQLWLGFEGLLRPGELHKLCRRHLGLPSNVALAFARCLVVLLTDPKNRRAFGRCQTTVIRDESLIAWIEWFSAGLPMNARLATVSLPKMRVLLQQALAELHLSKLGLTLASLRAGKATLMYMSGESIGRIRIAGRWKSLASLEHYIQEASSMSVLNSMGARGTDIVQELMSQLHLLERPPAQPWQAFFSRSAQFTRLRNLKKL